MSHSYDGCPNRPRSPDHYRAMSTAIMCIGGEDIEHHSPLTPCSHDFQMSGDRDTRAQPQAPEEVITPDGVTSVNRDAPRHPVDRDRRALLDDFKMMVTMLDNQIADAQSTRAKWQKKIDEIETPDREGEGLMLPRMGERMQPKRRFTEMEVPEEGTRQKRSMTLKQAARCHVMNANPKNPKNPKVPNKTTSSKGPIVPCSLNSRCTKNWEHDGDCNTQGYLTKLCNADGCVKRWGHRGRCLKRKWPGYQRWVAAAPEGLREVILMKLSSQK